MNYSPSSRFIPSDFRRSSGVLAFRAVMLGLTVTFVGPIQAQDSAAETVTEAVDETVTEAADAAPAVVESAVASADESIIESAAEPASPAAAMSEDQRLSYALGWIFARQSEDMLEVPLDTSAFMEGFRSGTTAPDSAAMSRAFGVLVGNDMQEDAGGLDFATLEQALAMRMAGEDPLLTDQEIQEAMFGFQQRAEEREARAAALATENYLLDVAAEEGVVALDSGLLVRMIEMGEGGVEAPRPSVGDEVRLNYELRDTDGVVIESTFDAEPVVFPITEGLIAGFREGVTQMPLGSTYEFVVPPALGYGGGGPRPNGVLIFRVQALEIMTSAPALPVPVPAPAAPAD